jgi:hypothetical protein
MTMKTWREKKEREYESEHPSHKNQDLADTFCPKCGDEE